ANVTSSIAVNGRVAVSHEPLFVKIGVRSWKAKRVPVGRSLARFAVLVSVWDSADGFCGRDVGGSNVVLPSDVELTGCLARKDMFFKSEDGQLYYGFATFQGMWLFDNYELNNVPDLSKYRLRFIDWVHALLSVLVFGAVALRDRNVVNCFYPSPGHEAQEVLDIVPIGVGLLSSALFVVFPTRRHGIGYPITPNNKD
nr:protein DMP3-like [Tanacetum cinerariifolium]